MKLNAAARAQVWQEFMAAALSRSAHLQGVVHVAEITRSAATTADYAVAELERRRIDMEFGDVAFILPSSEKSNGEPISTGGDE